MTYPVAAAKGTGLGRSGGFAASWLQASASDDVVAVVFIQATSRPRPWYVVLPRKSWPRSSEEAPANAARSVARLTNDHFFPIRRIVRIVPLLSFDGDRIRRACA